ncbi:hypothetical protein [Aquimarina agarilytica]|uniref:hypothetical protein n=1 Tax=Aquimarina agarilytica TaxID=1087449 RepID=UPI00028844C0|nr:hypothetical protein [Aquimarina agarilytica]
MWSYLDFKTYFLLYFSFSENVQGNQKRQLIIDSVGELKFEAHLDQILEDRSMVSRRKIRKYISKNDISIEKITSLYNELRQLFQCNHSSTALTNREEEIIKTIIKTYFKVDI